MQLVVLPPNDTEEAIRRGQVDAGALGCVLQDKAVATGGLRSLFSDFELFGTFPGGQIRAPQRLHRQEPGHHADLHHRGGQGHRMGTQHAPR